MKLVLCVPNFSEGRSQDIINAIRAEIEKVPNTKVIYCKADSDHNRLDLAFVAPIKEAKEAAFRATRKAAGLIDMDKHKGEHPRMGATDVIPFVPMGNTTMEECVEAARGLGKRIGEELKIPVYLYEEAATRPDRKNLADVRRGEYEGLKEEVGKNPDRKPDFGPEKLGKAGATAVGARMPLIAFNVNLGTSDLTVAKKIARAVRHSSGGLRYVKAMGFELKERGIVQVSMNLTNYKKTPIFRVFELVRREAKRYGIPVIGSEIVGVVPMDALVSCADFYLQLEKFKKDQILENKLWGEKNEGS
ncbi:MAG: glutamate formimidoyltransferase [Candidatus Diapherotrites archaeon]|nr:glutamate formimidoyltransferase [Candidatus Diapherotrites archaeon]